MDSVTNHTVDAVSRARAPGRNKEKDIGNFDREEIAFFCIKRAFHVEDKKPLGLTKCFIRR